ncbi:MAG: helix-turn-helix transcriptional regulator [Peptococcaceae bacterium]|nr:helix-turn-helix transcriptional regulator [Peptococcaceae bacterium]
MLHDQIKYLRLRLGISQSELARRAGYSHEFISQVERGIKSPSIKALQKIAWGLGVSPSLLMESKHQPPESEEKLKNELHRMINVLPLDKLKVIRDLLRILPVEDNPPYLQEKFKVLER